MPPNAVMGWVASGCYGATRFSENTESPCPRSEWLSHLDASGRLGASICFQGIGPVEMMAGPDGGLVLIGFVTPPSRGDVEPVDYRHERIFRARTLPVQSEPFGRSALESGMAYDDFPELAVDELGNSYALLGSLRRSLTAYSP